MRRLAQAKARPSHAAHLQDASLLGVNVLDARQHPHALDAHALRVVARFSAPAHADHAKRAAAAQALTDQVQIARLEHLKRQQPPREQHRLQWEQGQWIRKRVSCSVRQQWIVHGVIEGQDQSPVSSSRCRIRVVLRCLKRSASISTP